jgi:hypothetical protein
MSIYVILALLLILSFILRSPIFKGFVGESYCLRTINKYKEVFLATDEVRNIYNTFQAGSIKDENIKKDHVKAIKSEMAENNNKIANNECPKCGGMLVERRGKYGKFKGCGNFPRCRFVLN